MNQPLWTPSPARIAATQLTRFMQVLGAEGAPHFSGYHDLYRWSVEYPEQFWSAVWRFCGVQATREWDRVLEAGTQMSAARWFDGARLNFAANLLQGADDATALIFRDERGTRRELSYATLRAEVARIAAGLRAAGVKSGDRVAGYLPNLPETVIAMLASASLGAVWSSCSPDFGVHGVLDRFGQIEPRVLFAVDGYCYGGKSIDCRPRIRELLAQLPHAPQLVLVNYLDPQAELEGACSWQAFGTPGAALEFVPLPFSHPLYILFSSGTTGTPKCIVHGAGGTLLQHLKEIVLLNDTRPGDRVFFFTTCGWMMWNWLVSNLAARATVVLYEGSPLHPDPQVLWRLADEEQLRIFGTSPRFLSACEKSALRPCADFSLAALEQILSTGSPLAPENFRYVYRDVKQDVQLSSISGGTDIVSCFAFAVPILPVYEGELQARALGMKVEIFDEAGRSVHGAKGELVCTAPFPCMPVGFWNDPDGRKYHAAYFERFPGIWCHGDFAALTEHDGLVIYGRSDAVLNPGGVRIGTAEIYRQVEAVPEVLESVAIGQDWDNDVRVVLFVRLRESLRLDDALRDRIRKAIRANTTPRHVPAKILQVQDIPRTVSGKIVELAVRNVVHGSPVTNTDAIANPQALEQFRDRAELAS
ncbi:MAG: acetoacetate--CoA ligase [Steroidobacteraceae bacterium]